MREPPARSTRPALVRGPEILTVEAGPAVMRPVLVMPLVKEVEIRRAAALVARREPLLAMGEPETLMNFPGVWAEMVPSLVREKLEVTEPLWVAVRMVSPAGRMP